MLGIKCEWLQLIWYFLYCWENHRHHFKILISSSFWWFGTSICRGMRYTGKNALLNIPTTLSWGMFPIKGNYRAASYYLQLFIKSQNEICFLPGSSILLLDSQCHHSTFYILSYSELQQGLLMEPGKIEAQL